MTAISVVTFFLSIVAFYLIAYKSRPANNGRGEVLGNEFNSTAKQINIGTYNVQSGKNSEGQRDISRAAKIIQYCDIVAVQEVYGKPWFSNTSQIDQLAQPNQMVGLFAPTRRRWLRDHRGNGLLTKVKLGAWQYQQLPDKTGKQFRNVVIADIPYQNTNIKMISTHLHTSKGRDAQLKTILEIFLKHDHAILLGDLNTRKDDPQIQALLKYDDIEDVLAQSNKMDSPERIDWILCKNITAKPFQFEPIGVSDHPFFSVTITGLQPPK